VAICFYRKRSGAPLDRARTEGDYLGHGGLWSDNSVAMVAALFRIQFPLTAGGMVASPEPRLAPTAPDLQQLNQDKAR
jgi:hypothetical protein